MEGKMEGRMEGGKDGGMIIIITMTLLWWRSWRWRIIADVANEKERPALVAQGRSH